MTIFLLAVLGAAIPTVVYVSILWWLDRYEKEPWWLLAMTFAWGAVPAIILAAISEMAAGMSLMMHQPGAANLESMTFTMAVVAPLVEESLKGVPLLIVFLVFRREFDGLMDGLLYGALVGFGFAMTENFLYIFGAGSAGGVQAEAFVFFLRTIVFGMMHALWSSMFGIGLAIARYSHSPALRVAAPCGGLLLGMLLHSLHNYSAVTASQGGSRALLLVGLMISSYGLGCLAWLVLVYLAGRREAVWIREELREEVDSGLLRAEHATACGRYRSRVSARWAALKEHGVGHAHRLGRLYALGAELAFRKRQQAIDHRDMRYASRIEQLRDELRAAQQQLLDDASEG